MMPHLPSIAVFAALILGLSASVVCLWLGSKVRRLAERIDDMATDSPAELLQALYVPRRHDFVMQRLSQSANRVLRRAVVAELCDRVTMRNGRDVGTGPGLEPAEYDRLIDQLCLALGDFFRFGDFERWLRTIVIVEYADRRLVREAEYEEVDYLYKTYRLVERVPAEYEEGYYRLKVDWEGLTRPQQDSRR